MFQGRPDALGPYSDAGKSKSANPAGHPGDDPLVANGVAGESGATNLGPRSPGARRLTRRSSSTYWHAGASSPTSDLVTTSGSGHRPRHHAARRQAEIPMVSRATGLSAATLQHLISQQTQGHAAGLPGSPYVNVLQLNEALAKLKT